MKVLLTFENALTFTDGQETFCGEESNGLFIEFFLSSGRLGNKSCYPPTGQFNDLTFVDEPRRITPELVKDFGIKTFPHFGIYGFYTPQYSPTSIVVIPINKNNNAAKHPAPEVVITDTGTTIHLAITGDYECFRIIVRLTAFATEFVTYDDQFDFLPMYTGDCSITVIGFSNEISIQSEPYIEIKTLVDRT